jgi:histidinol-phosphate/aromatic aminotransferase/cobyric acid decarboxylase-like protein
MGFPLGDWVLGHEGLPHDLAQSGMKGQLRSTPRLLRSARPGDPHELQRRLSELLGVSATQVILTPGATSANGLVIAYLARWLRRRRSRAPVAGLRAPEYPPLWDVAMGAGFRTRQGFTDCDLALLSNPNNPEGFRRSDLELLQETSGARWRLVDETFREFTSAPSLARRGDPRTWVTGTFTKVYGADLVRAGYVVAPRGEARAFADSSELWADRLSYFSVGAALTLLDHRAQVLAETRGIFERNRDVLARAVGSGGDLAAPVWFDRRPLPGGTERFARQALRRGVLVCPGHFFRDARGIRVCLTSRSFPRDLRAYLAERSRAPPRASGRAGQ